MKKLSVLFILLLLSNLSIGQRTVKELVAEGIELHDNGDYSGAIEMYKKALKKDPKSSLIHYEISLSYFKNEEYKKSIKHAEFVIDQKDQNSIPAYINKGNCLDLLGKPDEAIKLYKKAIKKEKNHYLLYYNLGVTLVKQRQYEEAAENCILAIGNNGGHSSSHLLLGTINGIQKNQVQTVLALHYFLLLEPRSSRSENAYNVMQENFGGSVSKDGTNQITISISGDEDTRMMAAVLSMAIFSTTDELDSIKGVETEIEKFIDHTTSFFSMLGEMVEKKEKEIWWTYYIPFYAELAKSDHMETYCHYISQSSREESAKWIEENEDALIAFGDWLKGS